jgi:hypothetical protein
MKRLFLVLIPFLLLTGCNKVNKEKDVYNSFIDELKKVPSYSSNVPFDINVVLEKDINSELTYTVILDKPKKEIRNIEAVAIHNFKTDDMYPSIGIFDDKLSLIPNKIDINNNLVEGIILVGYIKYDGSINDFNGIIKVLIRYEDSNGKIKKIYYKYQNETK